MEALHRGQVFICHFCRSQKGAINLHHHPPDLHAHSKRLRSISIAGIGRVYMALRAWISAPLCAPQRSDEVSNASWTPIVFDRCTLDFKFTFSTNSLYKDIFVGSNTARFHRFGWLFFFLFISLHFIIDTFSV